MTYFEILNKTIEQGQEAKKSKVKLLKELVNTDNKEWMCEYHKTYGSAGTNRFCCEKELKELGYKQVPIN